MKQFLFILFLFPFALEAQYGIDFSSKNFEEVQKEAKAANKLIFVDGYTEWCEPCKLMDIGVFTSQRVGIEYNKQFISYKMDMEKGMGPIMGVRYGVSVIPTFLFLTSDGTLVYSISGYQGEEELISAAQVALNPGRKETAWDKRYNEGDRKGDFLLNYVYHKYENQDPIYTRLVNEYLETQEDWGSESNVKFIYNFLDNTDSPLFDYMAANKTNFYKSFGEEKITKTIDVLVNNKMYNSSPAPSLEEIGVLLNKAYPEDGAKRYLDIRLARFLKEGNHKDYAMAVMEYLELNPSTDTKELISYANYFNTNVNDPTLLKYAVDWAENGVAKNPSMDNYRLLTDLYSKTGERKKAIKACKKGIKLAKKTKQDSTFLKALLKNVKAKKK